MARYNAKLKQVQIMLNYMGYRAGTADGFDGLNTRAATKRYQAAHPSYGLAVDGICGAKTYPRIVADYKWHVANNAKKSSGSGNQLSAHFKKTEFKCPRYCNGYPASIDASLVAKLELVRQHFGRSVVITSGLRCKKYNSSLRGSVPNSAHRAGKAADIYIAGVTNTAAGRAAVKAYWYHIGGSYCYYGTSNMGNAVHCQVA